MRNPDNQKISTQAIFVILAAQFLLCVGCFANISPKEQNQPSVKKGECKITPLAKSKATIELILNDVSSTYAQVGGGGITAIKQSHTDVFVVSISQEERIDQLTYETAMDEVCKVKIIKKVSSTINYNR